jgi:YspA, cpYpsA-related SLOG family
MIFVVRGSRKFRGTSDIYKALDALHAQYQCSLCITGDADSDGADNHPNYWAKSRGINQIIVPVNLKDHGEAARAIRNSRMLRVAQVLAESYNDGYILIAFLGEKGTDDICHRARAAGVPIIYPMGEPVNAS